MVSVTKDELVRDLTRYLERARSGETVVILDGDTPLAVIGAPPESALEIDEDAVLRRLAAQGRVIPARTDPNPNRFRHRRVPCRGKLASEIVSEDRGQ